MRFQGLDNECVEVRSLNSPTRVVQNIQLQSFQRMFDFASEQGLSYTNVIAWIEDAAGTEEYLQDFIFSGDWIILSTSEGGYLNFCSCDGYATAHFDRVYHFPSCRHGALALKDCRRVVWQLALDDPAGGPGQQEDTSPEGRKQEVDGLAFGGSGQLHLCRHVLLNGRVLATNIVSTIELDGLLKQ